MVKNYFISGFSFNHFAGTFLTQVFPLGGDILGKMAKKNMKITKSTFWGVKQWETWEYKPTFWVVRGGFLPASTHQGKPWLLFHIIISKTCRCWSNWQLFILRNNYTLFVICTLKLLQVTPCHTFYVLL